MVELVLVATLLLSVPLVCSTLEATVMDDCRLVREGGGISKCSSGV